ncbi:hypothetical protein IU433_07400 [Nocardia puris]|uniref:SH3 domain-containing protein n=2 Tax=Nocardia puris TaxID=208602 RepID=A0A366DL00_9NOCA|nr:hypothetical protein [Nocardia puris]MBF6458867.1 hypothetical protein [Nocardia puris]RBO90721.1 hypothetical protein DFR74_105123 [Nocardia puris]
MSGMRKVFTLATAVLGAGLAVAGTAQADPADPTQFSDVTATFVSGLDPAALNAARDGKNVIVSPYGTTRTIACRGNGAEVPLYDCMQEDDLGWITLQKNDLPGIGPAWVYIP